ncbi:MAG TPA: hypothetical protein VK589_04045 [Chryseolinea sp.]|nr:hypothetical protein [Chryseolinea sp.]
MIEEELIRIWQSSSNQERVKFEKSRLMIDVQSSMDRLHRRIKYRDLRELIAVIIVVPVFAYYIYIVPFILSKVASFLIIIWGIYIVYRLRNARKHKPGAFTETYLDYLYKTREYIGVQKHMIDNVLYWYILPCWALVTLFIAGFIGVPGKLKWMIQTESFSVVLSVAIYYLNKAAVKKQLVPRLVKIDELIKVMEQS